ncbi:UDP-N-acetylmuramoylalanine--D-glutamate ligase [Desulfovibrio sp. X2]|uniref:UDP-N-acetylmuramoyl-L-alanine--D-glutamate ligase n=1 Tax=Desulfovibrio sp. X2 TaxID=941449 RepID=UPI000358EF41|nr:UDP-N-acetylmuramoyl-L-alanine--D-glutamate ligase [Desulfovibrio sp. X2]EPR44450.1 UDP-N-acetylmuramoylalanine--D-glutamate ligase [Desulfovibrio sp. X2]
MRELIHPGQLRGHKAVVVGAGASGRAAVRLLLALGAEVTLLDKAEPSDAVRAFIEETAVAFQSGAHSAGQFTGADMIVLSPGIARASLEKELTGIPEQKIMAELELASWFFDAPVIAVTGTNGKTTTVSLIAHMLETAGKKVFLGGNIGTPPSEYLLSGERADVLVLEVSSFQLQNCHSFHPQVGVLLNFSPNHLDYHKDMEEYLRAKLQLFAVQAAGNLAIAPLEMRDELERRAFTKASRTYFVPTERFTDVTRLVGPHNKANMEAAWLAVRPFGVTEEQARAAVATFTPKPHRLQIVAEKRGVLFVDDSKATTLDAVAAAVASFDRPIRLLAGGKFKGGEPAALVPLLKERVKSIGLFGASREVFEPAWAPHLPVFWEPTLEPAVRKLFAEAQEGDVILLSPGTSSFDLYGSYKERGDDFKRIAEGL